MTTTEKACAVESCGSKFYAREMCGKHYKRLMKHGDPLVCKQGGGFRGRGAGHPGWKGRQVNYRSAHARIQHLRGKAAEHECGCGAPADEWAYDYTDPCPLMGSNGRYAVIYSPDVDRYRPMCRPCHRAFDMERDGEKKSLRTDP